MQEASETLTAVDVFCGAGGLTLGLKQAGFHVVAGVEINKEYAKTYVANHPEVKVFTRDVREVEGKEILEATGLDSVDLLAGCPPCEGFSKLTDKYHRDDPRNDLVLEMARLIEEIKPKAVMMENVAGLATRGKPKLDQFVMKLTSLGYSVNYDVLQLANYGVPQSRRRLVLFAGMGFVILPPKQTRAYREDRAKGLKRWMWLEDFLPNLGRPVTLSKAMKNGGPRKFNWHVVRDIEEMTKKRLRAVKTGRARDSLPKVLRPECHTDSSYDGFKNVYGRLSWKSTPPTITGGCTTFCKGRFGHPTQLRTISVREAALIQTFPRSYKFESDYIDMVCDLVGNAFPPKFAKLAALECLNVIQSQGEIVR
jgi:DNA (cytosine-5)-methyltransferase 1